MGRSFSRNYVVVKWVVVWSACVPVGAVLAQQPAGSIEEFRASLDARVFQPGGYGPWAEPLGPILEQAAATYNVPRALLVTLGYMGSAFENRGDQPTIEYGYGVMALRENAWGGDSLALAARLLNASPDAVRTDPRLNIAGAAAVIDAYANEAKLDRTAGPDAWLGPVIRYAGLDVESSRLFAKEVFEHLKAGLEATNTWGETFSFPPQPVTIDLQSLSPPPEPGVSSTDYGPATWDPAASCNYSAYSTSKDTVVIHTIEGSAAGARSWFKNCAAQCSAHYVVSEGGGVWQMVRETYKAWHALCYNSRALGIEHEGYASSSSHPHSLYDASALLTRDMCDDWGIPKEKRTSGPGILGHADVTHCCCGTHTDPGSGWDWTYYIQQVRGTPPPPAWDADYHAQSYPSSMVAGSTAVVWMEFTNQGTEHWQHCDTKLGTSSPHDRSSPFCTANNWACADGSNKSCARPTDVDQSDVAKGAVGRFTFILTAPATAGTYTEKYQLYHVGGPWFGPERTWTITVTAAKGNLTGTVRNASNSQAISGATVTLSGVGSKTTNSSGVYTFSSVNAGSYTVSVSASGFNAASGSATVTADQTTTKDFSLTPVDTQAPTTPTGLTASATAPTTIHLAWTASTDNVGVAGYEIQRDGSTIATSTTTSYNDTGVTPNTTHTYKVRAKDAVPNFSAWSGSASATTPPAPPTPTIVFSDGFNGNLNNWAQQVGGFAYSTTVTHGTYTGAGAAYCAAGNTDQMYRAFSRPFAQGKVWGYFYDGKGGWKAGSCGWSYRQALSLRDPDNSANMFIDNELYNSPDNAKYYFRLIGAGGGGTHTTYATRDPNTDCTGAWIYFETTVTPGAVGASPTGTFVAKVTDGAGSTTTTQNLTTDFFSWGIGRVTVGLGISSTNECYWDDIAFQATPPDYPTMGTPTVVSSTQIRWNFSPRDNNFFGWDVADSAGTIVSPQYDATGWLGRSATSWTESGLTPNTQYTRKVRAWNGTLSGLYSTTAQASTLSVPPAAGSVVPDASTVCAGEPVTWTAVNGFGAGKVQYYKYAWDQSPTHTFGGSEANWSSDTITTTPTVAGTWYLHVQGYNALNVANGSYHYALPTKAATVVTQQPAAQGVCAGSTVQLSLAATGDGTLSYQWQQDGVDLSDSGDVSGTSTPVLQVANVGLDDVGQYQCIVTGGCGQETSNAAALSLEPATTITEQPLWRDVCAGERVTFTVSAAGEGALAYQWLRDGAIIAGATSSTLQVVAGKATRGTYACVVTGGCDAVVSSDADLSVRLAAADFNEDCDVDLTDFTVFQACFNGPNSPPAAGCAVNADFDGDGDVDLNDFVVFQICFYGPNQSPTIECPER